MSSSGSNNLQSCNKSITDRELVAMFTNLFCSMSCI